MALRPDLARTLRGAKALVAGFRSEARAYRLALADPRTPRVTKLLLAAAVAYVLSPVDLIPDFVPFFGQVDDAAVALALVKMALKTIPEDVMRDCRRRAAGGGR